MLQALQEMDGKVDQAFIDGLRVSRVAVDFMNTVHEEELALVARLLQALQANDTAVADPLLSEWVQHTREHFARENHLMAEHDFPPYPVHSAEHERALAAMLACEQQWQADKQAAAVIDYITDAWWPWLQRHIATMDVVTANYLSQMNLDVEL